MAVLSARTRASRQVLEPLVHGSLALVAQDELVRQLPTILPAAALEELRALHPHAVAVATSALAHPDALEIRLGPGMSSADAIVPVGAAIVVSRDGHHELPALEPWRGWAKRWRVPAPCVITWAFMTSVQGTAEPAQLKTSWFRAMGWIPAEDELLKAVTRKHTVAGVAPRFLADTATSFVRRVVKAAPPGRKAELRQVARAAFLEGRAALLASGRYREVGDHLALRVGIRWTLEAYVARRRAADIAAAASCSPAVVQRYVTRYAQLVGLPLRRRGRPRARE